MSEQKEFNQKTQALEQAISHIEKQFGKGSIMKLGDESAKVKIPAIPTGSLELDIALGIGGIPRGRVVEIYGPESSGKTTLTLHIIAQAQKAGKYSQCLHAGFRGGRPGMARLVPARCTQTGGGECTGAAG